MLRLACESSFVIVDGRHREIIDVLRISIPHVNALGRYL